MLDNGDMLLDCSRIDTSAAQCANEFGEITRENLQKLRGRYPDALVTVGTKDYIFASYKRGRQDTRGIRGRSRMQLHL